MTALFGTSWRAGRIAGWFLVQAARASYQELQVRHLLRGVQAQDVMAGDLVRMTYGAALRRGRWPA